MKPRWDEMEIYRNTSANQRTSLYLSLTHALVLSWTVFTMAQFSALVFLAVLFAFFAESEANPFVYNYEKLRIGGVIIACLLVVGGLAVLFQKKCTRKTKKSEDNTSEI
ncbi:hypothetical protein UPYG_G00151490 [Umbra pygmaea]|uniref:FXYD domain-containing ion transport regulator n=1 Tax=Umbra pygmaea TaxID=75934 RepID=A0ABD0XD71_UMBPY